MVAKCPYKAKKQQGNNHIKEKHADGKINVDRIKRVTHYYEVKKDQPAMQKKNGGICNVYGFIKERVSKKFDIYMSCPRYFVHRYIALWFNSTFTSSVPSWILHFHAD